MPTVILDAFFKDFLSMKKDVFGLYCLAVFSLSDISHAFLSLTPTTKRISIGGPHLRFIELEKLQCTTSGKKEAQNVN